MAVFEYTAINAKGRKVRGVIDAEGAKAARQRLKSKGIFATDLKETRTKAKSGASNKRGYHFVQARVSLGELSLATRQLSTLVGAGISLVEALKALGDQLDSDKLKRIFSEICEQVTEGSSLAEALKSYPRIFPQLYINMVASGEASGSLDLVLERLADLLESQAELRRKIISASAYPILMLVVIRFLTPPLTLQPCKELNLETAKVDIIATITITRTSSIRVKPPCCSPEQLLRRVLTGDKPKARRLCTVVSKRVTTMGSE